MPPERPTAKEIDEKVFHYLHTIWRDTHANMEDNDTYIDLSYNVWDRDDQRKSRGQFRPSTPKNIVNHASDQFLAHIPDVNRDPIDVDKDESEEDSNNVAVGLKHVMMDAARRAVKGNPWKQTGKYFSAHGYGVLELALDFTGPREDRRFPGFWNPVRLEALHPSRVLMDPDEKIPTFATKRFTMNLKQLKALLRQKHASIVDEFDPKNRAPWEDVALYLDWDMDWVTLKEPGERILYQQRNTWGLVPYLGVYAGFGMEKTSMATNDASFLAEGILQPVKGSIKMQAQGMTAKHYSLMDSIYAPYGSENPDAMLQSLDTGAILPGREDEYWKLRVQELPRNLFEAGRETDRDIERGTMSPSLFGENRPGVTTVGQTAIENDTAMRKFSGPSQQVEFMATTIGSWILRLVDKLPQLKGGIGANGHAITRGDIGHRYHCDIGFPVLNQAMELQLREVALREYELELLSDQTYWETKSRLEDPSLERKRLNQQRVRRSPAVIARMVAAEAEAMDEMDAEDAAALRQDIEGQENAGINNGVNGTQQAAQPLRQPLSDNFVRPKRIDIP
jgi:hypothetical protein